MDATPNMTDLSAIKNCNDVKEQLESDLALETDAVTRLNAAVKVATQGGDNVSSQLFSRILADEDHHVDYLQGQLHIIGEIGLKSYLAQQIYQ